MLSIPLPKRRQVLSLSLPIIISMLSINIFDLVDTAMIAHLGDEALAATGFSSFLYWSCFSVFIGLGTATQTLTARQLGLGVTGATLRPFLSSLVVVTAYALPLMLLMMALSSTILSFFTSSPQVLKLSLDYFDWRILGLFASGYNLMFRGFWNGIKEPRVYTVILISTHLLNVLLNWVLIFGHFGAPQLGVKGAAIGSTLSLYTGVLLYALVLWFKKKHLFAGLRRFKIDHFSRLLKLGIPAAFDQLLFALSLLSFFWIFGQIGTTAAAVAHVVLLCSVLLWMPGLGFGMAALTLVSESIGAGRFEEAREWPWLVIKVGIPYIIAIGIVLSFFPQQLLSLFIKNPTTLDMAILPLRIDMLTLWIAGMATIYTEALNGASATGLVMQMKLISRWLLLLPGAAFIGLYGSGGLPGIWLYWAFVTGLELLCFYCLFKRIKLSTR